MQHPVQIAGPGQSEVTQHHVAAFQRAEQRLVDRPDHELGERAFLPAAQPVVSSGSAGRTDTMPADAIAKLELPLERPHQLEPDQQLLRSVEQASLRLVCGERHLLRRPPKRSAEFRELPRFESRCARSLGIRA
jgi:hypothetical protein